MPPSLNWLIEKWLGHFENRGTRCVSLNLKCRPHCLVDMTSPTASSRENVASDGFGSNFSRTVYAGPRTRTIGLTNLPNMTSLAAFGGHTWKLEIRPIMSPPTESDPILAAVRFACSTNWWASCFSFVVTSCCHQAVSLMFLYLSLVMKKPTNTQG